MTTYQEDAAVGHMKDLVTTQAEDRIEAMVNVLVLLTERRDACIHHGRRDHDECEFRQARHADDLLRDTDLAWDAVLDTLPAHAQPGRMVTGLPPRTTFRNQGERS